MADSNMLNEELHHYEPEPETVPEPEPETTPELVPEEPESAAPEPLSVTPPEPVPEEPDSTSEPVPEPVPDLFSVDEIVDLVGGARDALERHRAEDSAPPVTETLEEPVTIPEPVIPDSTTSSVPEELPVVPEELPVEVPEESPVEVPVVPPVVAPIAVPESVKLAPVAPAPPVPAPPPAAEARTAAEAPAPSYETSPSKAPSLPLMHFPTALGQKGDPPAPISPLSPLHSPDSLEELSLTESPNQPLDYKGPTGPLGSFPKEPPVTLSKDGHWGGEEGDPGTGRGKIKEDLLDPLAAPYLSLGKDPGPHNPCEDSGISFSPEEKLAISDRFSTGPSPVTPPMMALESHLASSNPTERWDSPLLGSQDNSKVSMDSFTKDPPRYEPNPLDDQSDEDDDLMYGEKKKNPFEGFSPLADSGFSHIGDSKSDSRVSKTSDSPTPDLVQYRGTGGGRESPLSFLDQGMKSETSKMAPESLVSSMSEFSSGLKDEDDDEDEEDSALPPSLPDILKSSPLNPEKVDSGSSEGSPEEQSPILERRMMESPNPPINLSANNPFAFDAKVSLLKEMTEEMEVKAADKGKPEDDKTFDAFDPVKAVKETLPTMKAKVEEPVKIEQKDWFSSQDSPKKSDKFGLDFESKKTPAEDSDSESPTADSLSPVLEAMAKNPARFQVEMEKEDQKMEVEEAEVAEEVSEHEVSSEEFEFIERPPRGVIDEFLEALDTSKMGSSRPPEIPLDEEPSPALLDPSPALKEVGQEAQSPSSFRLLTSPQKSKAELEKGAQQQLPHHPKTPPGPNPEKPEAVKREESGKVFKTPKLDMIKVVDLLYWRDVRSTGVVFGAALLLLLSLTACSIVSVSAYIGLALLSVTICLRIYRGVLQAVQKSDEGHPFRQYLDQEVALSEDLVHKYSDAILERLNKTIVDLRRVFLVEDLVDSIKFAVLMWILTYVGSWFNGLTLLILGLIAAFSCPIVYEKHQAQIDHYVSLVNNQIKDVVGKVQAKVPGMKPKAE